MPRGGKRQGRTLVTLCNYDKKQRSLQILKAQSGQVPGQEAGQLEDSDEDIKELRLIITKVKELINERKRAGARGYLIFKGIENPSPSLITSTQWNFWCDHDIVEPNLQKVLEDFESQEIAA